MDQYCIVQNIQKFLFYRRLLFDNFFQSLSLYFKMATVHVYFNYKRDYRHTKLCCILAMMMILVFPIFVMHSLIEYGGHPKIVKTNYCCTRALQHSAYVASSLLYIVLLRNLCIRYESLNLLLKTRFLSEATANSSACKSNTIQLIKFIGQQHCALNDIMELNNFCYAFQVTKE